MDGSVRIYIIEDNEAILAQLKDIAADYKDRRSFDCEIRTIGDRFCDIPDSLEIDPARINIYFLDIILGNNSNGLKLAQKIRDRDIRGYIIFVTSHLEFAFPAIQYKIRALDYILKSDEDLEGKVHQCLDTIRNELKRGPETEEQTILIKTNGTHFIIPLNEIIYFETNTYKRSIIMHAQNKTIEFRDTLDELQKRLNESFYRCHRSFLINLRYIQTISRRRNDLHVMLKDGTKCLISPRYLRGLLRYEGINA